MSKHRAIPKKLREALYQKYNKCCAYCGCRLEYKDMQIDHIASVYVNTDIRQTMTEQELYDIKNLMPTCRQCNFYKSTFSIEDFRERLQSTMLQNLEKNFNYRLAKKYGFVEEIKKKKVTFYFETLKKEE